MHSQYNFQKPKTCFHIWGKCFASIQETSECGIQLDAIISTSCFFLMMNMVICIKDPLKGRVLSLIMQADTVRNVNGDPLLPLLLWGNTPKLKMLFEVRVRICPMRTASKDYKWEGLSQITVLTGFKSTAFWVHWLQFTLCLSKCLL